MMASLERPAVALDSLELQLAAALQRLNALQRRAATNREPAAVLDKALSELGTALEQLRAAQGQLIESRNQIEELHRQLRLQTDRYWRLFDAMPEPCVVTRSDSTITEVNKAAARLLNVSQRFLVGKPLSVFVCANRAEVLAGASRAAADGQALDITLRLRPRERAPLTVRGSVTGDAGPVRWILRSSEPSNDERLL